MSATHRLLRFGVFELNLDTEELRKFGTPVKLRPQPFQLLALLASRAGQVVTREEIQRLLWGEDTYVDFEHGMNRCITQIRTVLSDEADHPVYIETVPRHGYRFLAPVTMKMVLVPPAKVKESSSETSADLAEAIRTRLEAKSQGGSGAQAQIAVDGTVRPQPLEIPQAQEKPRRRSWPWIVSAGFVVLALLLGGLYVRTKKAAALTERDTIVLADFDNKTGDSVFDATLRQGLWSGLEQSPFLNILSDQRIAQTMSLMAQPKGAVLTPELARQVCIRTESAATLNGAIAVLGQDYVVSLNAVNCQTGREIAIEQFAVDRKEKILPALGKAASQIRRKLGESVASVEKYDVPLQEATTPSLEALKAYSLGRKARSARGNTAALPFYKRAVELDPNFAMAYVSLASAYRNLNQVGRATENARKAYELREKVSERERLDIEAYYHMRVTGDLEKAAQLSELRQQTHPREDLPYTNLAVIYCYLGNWEKVLEEGREALRLEPNSSNYVNLGWSYTSLNRLEEAEAVFKQAEERKLEGEFVLVGRYQLAFLKGDVAKMAKLVSAAAGKPGKEDVLLAWQADTEAWYGKLKNARELTRQAMDSAQHNDADETAAAYQAEAALREAESGNRERARADADAAVSLASNRDVRSIAALAFARAGDTRRAEKLGAELDKTFPLDTLVQRYWLPTIRAAVALQQKDPNRAVVLLKAASPIELGEITNLPLLMYPVYLRGEAYLMLHNGNAAAAEFQKFIDHRGVAVNSLSGPPARLGLARAYAMQGDPVKARTAYEDFLTLWKDADPDIPIYRQAKAEYAKLN
jgi:DNA-binding winged helix-turn-helix (wHTH) protein/tetratricopeptide (TPR) repeat protein